MDCFDRDLDDSRTNEHWDYSFDEFNRIAGANQTNGAAPPRAMTFKYDQFGNRWQQNNPGGNTSNFIFSGNNNRIDGYTYDAAGNLTNDHVHTYTYDAESRMTQVDSGTTASYVYDAFSRRVRVNVPGGSDADNRECVYYLGGHCIAKFTNSTGTWKRSEIYALGQSIATYNNGATYFNHTDHLGRVPHLFGPLRTGVPRYLRKRVGPRAHSHESGGLRWSSSKNIPGSRP